MLAVIRKPMYNAPEVNEYFLALKDFPLVPMPTPRTLTREQLIETLEYYLYVAKNGEVMEVTA